MNVELTPRGLLSTFFRHQFKFWTIFLLIMLIGISYIILAKPIYEASGSLLVRFGQNVGQNAPQADRTPAELSQNDRREIMQSNIDILQSHDLLRTLVNEVGAEKLYPGITERVAGRDSPIEAVIKKLNAGDLSVKSNQQSNVFQVALLNQDPELAAQFVRRLFELFIAKQSEIYNKPQTDFLQEQVKLAQEKLQNSQRELQKFKNQRGISSIEEELAQLLKDKGDASTIAFQAVDDAQTRYMDLKAKEAELLTTYNEGSPQVAQLRPSIETARQQLAERQADLKPQGKGSTPLAARVSAINRRIADLEMQRSQYNDLFRQVQIDEENYKTFQLKSESARVNETLNEKNITRISVVDEPIVPVKPVRPRKIIALGLSLVCGLIFGLSMIIGLEMFDSRFTRPEQLSSILQVPVIASFGPAQKRIGS